MAVLELLFGVLALLGGLFFIGAGGSGLLSMLGYGAYVGFSFGFGGFILAIGTLAIVVGWGMWSGREWARVLAIVLYGLWALFNLLSLIGGAISSVVGLLISVFLLWYMFRPRVKAFFGKGTETTPAVPAPPTATV